MTFVVQKSRNPMLNAAWAGFKKEQLGEKKVPKEEAPPAPAKKAVPVKKAKRPRS